LRLDGRTALEIEAPLVVTVTTPGDTGLEPVTFVAVGGSDSSEIVATASGTSMVVPKGPVVGAPRRRIDDAAAILRRT